MRCEEVVDALPQIMDGLETADRKVVRHIQTCLRCQAELVQYRKLFRVLHQMRSQEAEPPPGTVGRLLTGIEEAAERGAIRSALTGRRMAYVAGLTAAAGAAATAGVVVVLASRSRGSSGKDGLVGLPLAGRVPQAVSSLPGAILTRSPQGQ
ncbi:MAG TPA: hypothetical protein VF005_02640 [Acidimicrobiales bacterium]